MIRLVAYNVTGAVDAAAVTTVLSSLRADIVCVVEAPGRLGLRRLAAACDLTVASRAGRRRLGTAVLVGERVRVLSNGAVELPGGESSPARNAAQAILGAGALRLSVVAALLGLQPATRLVHGAELERSVAGVDVPSVIAGDLGEPPGGPTVRRLTGTFRDAFAVAGQGSGETYPTPHPTTRHDFVLTTRELVVERCWVPHEPPVDVASHHRPVVVELATSDSDVDRDVDRTVPENHAVRLPTADAGPDTAEPAA